MRHVLSCYMKKLHALLHPLQHNCPRKTLFCFHALTHTETVRNLYKVMESGSSISSYNNPGKGVSELEKLQKRHEEKTLKIQELKRQIESVKQLLENKKKKDVPEERKETFRNLSERYNSLREEYNALLAAKSWEKK
ncbi:hypothetical protein SLEP1_g27179 [Rubroshorea leprosula]|uniref:Uncharacterized protein n=2 Tax=Rubroshorea leprosula TaxID=152421 RepID=A0AAV5JPQ5_9ROSI|nr:hypothetical protein SLEP1_g27179 [Rubroshorea leprosula]